MNKLSRPATALLLSFALAFTPGRRRPSAEKVIVTGCSTVYPIVQMAAEELRRTRGLEISGQGGGSSGGLEDCLAGRNHLGAMARELTAEEKAQVQVYPIAYDGVGIVVQSSNQL